MAVREYQPKFPAAPGAKPVDRVFVFGSTYGDIHAVVEGFENLFDGCAFQQHVRRARRQDPSIPKPPRRNLIGIALRSFFR